jgi:hypothetical protein
VRHFFQTRKPQKPATSLDGVNGAEDRCQELFRFGIGFELYQFLIQTVQVLATLDKKIFNNLVHDGGWPAISTALRTPVGGEAACTKGRGFTKLRQMGTSARQVET